MINVLHMMEGNEPGGAETVLVEIATHLHDGYRSHGLVLEEGWTHSALKARGIPVDILPLERSFDFRWPGRLARLIQDRDIHLIQSHEFTTNCYATAAARMAGIPIVCTVHGKNYYPDRLYRRIATRWAAKNAGAFVSVSHDLSRFLTDRIGIPAARIHTIHNGADLARFATPEKRRAQTRKALGIPADRFVCITVAALFEVKAHKVLIDAAARLSAKAPHITFLLVGEGPLEAQLKTQAGQLNVDDTVRFAGFRRDIPDLLSAADLFVLPSYSEGLPVSVIEAAAAGLPVVASRVGGLSEIVEEDVTGNLVPAGDADALARAILGMAEAPSRARRMANAGQRAVRERFGMEQMIGAYTRLYTTLLGR